MPTPIPPLVSVIIPNYNHKKYLKQRIDSVLMQTFTDFELILLDDCSTDNSQKILLSYQNNPHVSHIILNPTNGGTPFIQWEKGIQLAKGKYLWIAESDDSSDPSFLAATVEQLEKHSEARLCLTGSHIIDEENTIIPTDAFDEWSEDGKAYLFQSTDYLKTHMLITNRIYNASMVLFRKEDCLSSIMECYRGMHYCGDWLFWIEQVRKGAVVEVHQKLNYFRKHPKSTTSRGSANGDFFKEIAFIKNELYTQKIHSQIEIIQDKHRLYRAVNHYPVSSRRRNELLKVIAKESNATYWHYLLWKLYKTYRKHFKGGLPGDASTGY